LLSKLWWFSMGQDLSACVLFILLFLFDWI
jgi:hypothetical protein